jgi:predicted lysophospholipase L1 biosynthesis ABC-type transport system permease subunit
VISENVARQVWPGESALGTRIKWGGVESTAPWFTVVGVAETTRYSELAEPRATLYLPAAQFVDGANSLALRLSLPIDTVAAAVRERVRELAPDVFVLRTQAFSELVARPLAGPRFVAWLSNVFGSLALLLAALGLYGVLAAFVRQATREIGVRVALGATVGDVSRLVLGEATRVAGVGIAVGLAGSVALSGVLGGMLYGVQPLDPLTITIAIAVLAVTTTVACYVPVRRATRVNVTILLRAE